jgi:hypothetical protein
MRYGTAIYTFIQLTPIEGIDLMVTGECEVSYKLFRKDPDVGIWSDYFEFDIGKIWLHPDKADGKMLELQSDNWLYKLIERFLACDASEYVQEFLAEDYSPVDY